MRKRDRWRRWRQWLDVLEEERRYADWKEKLWMICVIGAHAVLLVFRYRKARRTFFRKMRTCFRCPIFDRTMYRCREYSGSPRGCGCFVVYKSLVDSSCPADDEGIGGWAKALSEPGWRLG